VSSLRLDRMTNKESRLSHSLKSLTNESLNSQMNSIYNLGRTDERALYPTVRVLVCFIRCHRTLWFGSRWLAMDWFVAVLTRHRIVAKQWIVPACRGNVSAGRWLGMAYSGFQASCHNIMMMEAVSSFRNVDVLLPDYTALHFRRQ
jgi:hypothetical protein